MSSSQMDRSKVALLCSAKEPQTLEEVRRNRTFLSTEIYRSEAKLMVRIGRESATLDPTVATGQVMTVTPCRENEINSEIEILKSWELAQSVVDAIGPKSILEGPQEKISAAAWEPGQRDLQQFRSLFEEKKRGFEGFLLNLGLGKPLTEREKAIIQFRKNFTVEVLKNTNILSVSYEGPDHTLSQNILAKLIDFFLEKHIVTHRQAFLPGAADGEASQGEHASRKVGRRRRWLSARTASIEVNVFRRPRPNRDRIGAIA